ncbi:MAG: NAD-dependent epimerase/dehydratase family protein [Bryobacterales bacterium]|nr:NAD-dependent epimerase/dehydratase family protein [Bryobacterales bacterium]
MNYPGKIGSVAELEEVLSRPSARDVAAMAALDGDLMLLGAGGKMGPTLARLAKRASVEAGVKRRVIAVARFSDKQLVSELAAHDIEALPADLLRSEDLADLPDIPNIIYMAAKKFGTSSGDPAEAASTWAMNAYLPGRVAERFASSRIVSFSTGNVYPFTPAWSGGATEQTPLAPVGEYGLSALGRERIFTYFCHKNSTPMAFLRLNYAIDLRYGVLVDLGLKVLTGTPVDVSMGAVNVIWQRDANAACLGMLAHCATPPEILNLTGPETLSVRWLAAELGQRLGKAPVFEGEEQDASLLSNASKCQERFGYPTVPLARLLDWVAEWLLAGNETWNKPTKFQVRDGKF